jgi:hypothetical protein
MAHFGYDSDGEDQVELDLEEPSHTRDEEISGGGGGGGAAAAAATGRSPNSRSELQLSTLYAAEPHADADEREALHEGNSSNGQGLMVLPRSGVGVAPAASLSHSRRDGCCARAYERAGCDRKSTRVKAMVCFMIVAVAWIPILYSLRSTGGVKHPRHAACFPTGRGEAQGRTTNSTMVYGTPAPWETTPPNTLIAFVGDVALPEDGAATGQLYDLIRQEGAHALVIQGDLDYVDCPGAWDELLTRHFGESFPVFPVAGNHDVPVWSEYSQLIARRWERANVTTCAGLAGRAHTCTFRGIVMVQVAAGIFSAPHAGGPSPMADLDLAPFLTQQLAAHRSRWQIGSWHKNQADMQTGGKVDETGWEVYEACRSVGAFIATGHEHSYARTRLLDSFRPKIDVSSARGANDSFLPLAPGQTAVFCNGLGGRSVRDNEMCGDNRCPWFAKLDNSDTGAAAAAALFCNYHHAGNPNWARCYLKDIRNRIRDEFIIDVSALPQVPSPPGPTR